MCLQMKNIFLMFLWGVQSECFLWTAMNIFYTGWPQSTMSAYKHPPNMKIKHVWGKGVLFSVPSKLQMKCHHHLSACPPPSEMITAPTNQSCCIHANKVSQKEGFYYSFTLWQWALSAFGACCCRWRYLQRSIRH